MGTYQQQGFSIEKGVRSGGGRKVFGYLKKGS